MVNRSRWAAKLVVSFRHSAYRDFWMGTMLTQMALDATSLLLGWHMLEITGSPLWVALVTFATGLPMLLWSPLAGLLADRWDRPRIMSGTVLLAAAAVAGLGGLFFLKSALAWHLVIVAFILGSAFSIYAPARSVLLTALVPRHLLVNAALMQYSTTRVMSFMGPVFAGVMAASLLTTPALLINLLLLLGAAWLYWRMPAAKGAIPVAAPGLNWQHGFRELAPYLRQNRELLELIVLGLVAVPFGMTYQHLLPVFARDILHVGAAGLGLLTGAAFLGVSLIGFVLAVAVPLRKGPAVVLSAIFSGLGLALLAVCDNPALAVALLLLLGLVNGVFLSFTTVLFHTLPVEALRGRLMGLWGWVWGVAPFGALLTGAIAEAFDVRVALIASGAVCALWSGWLWFRAPALKTVT